MQLFLANASRQIAHVHYRVPEIPNIIEDEILPGAQIAALSGYNFTVAQLEVVISQLEGNLIPSIDNVDKTQYTPITYRIDKEIPESKIESVFENNVSIQAKDGKKIREKTAAAIDASLNAQQVNNGIDAAPTKVIIEQKAVGDNSNLQNGIHEEISITH